MYKKIFFVQTKIFILRTHTTKVNPIIIFYYQIYENQIKLTNRMNITNVLQDDLCDKLRFDHRQITNLGIGKEENKKEV